MTSLEEFAGKVGSQTPVPAGGSVAAVTAALSAALVEMIGRVAKAKRDSPSVSQMVEQGEQLRARLLVLAGEDAKAFDAVLAAKRDKSGSETDQRVRVAKAWRHAAQVPADVVRLSREVALLSRRAAQEGPPSTIGDAVMAALLSASAAAGSHLNLRLNLEAAGRPE